jgi:hypothetical protein
MSEDSAFWGTLPTFEDFQQVADPSVYAEVPSSWWVLLTDVEGSTAAIEAGRYKDVNALGASVIAALGNTTGGADLPFVFGGDGATILLPPEHLDGGRRAAAAAVRAAADAFDLTLRAGLVPVAEIHAAGHSLRVARFQMSPHVHLAMFDGGGVSYAESLVKDPARSGRYAVQPAEALDPALFSGFECRWQPIAARNGETLSLLVVADHAETYHRVIDRIDTLTSNTAVRPSDESNLRLAEGLGSRGPERLLRAPGWRGLMYRLKVWLQLRVFKRSLALGAPVAGFDGSRYRAEVVANTDFRKFDDALRMVLDVHPEQRQGIQAALAAEHAAGALCYGTHVAPAALMTCLISDRAAGHHLHFVDGADGGYALAAKQLKAQLKQRATGSA